MSNFQFSNSTLSQLREAGWTEGYKYDVQFAIQALAGDGFTVHTVVIDFLSNFGELEINVVYQKNKSFHFSATSAADMIFAERVEYLYEKRLGKKLCVIGAFSGYMTLMMDEEGQVYGGYEEEFFFVGKSGREAIEILCQQTSLSRVSG